MPSGREDFITEVTTALAEASSFRGGADAAKPASPVAKDIYWATDTKILYLCVADGAWTGLDFATLVQGIVTLYANLAGGGYRITNIADPTAAQDAATRAYVLAQLASYLALTGGTLTGNLSISKADPVLQLINAASRQSRMIVSTEPYLYLQVDNGSGGWVTVFYVTAGLAAPDTYFYRPRLATNLNADSYKITGLGAPTVAGDAARKDELVAVSVSQPSRALDTVYQNTSGKIKLVTVTGLLDTNEEVVAYIGTSSPPTTAVGFVEQIGATRIYAPITFLVPLNYYYKVAIGLGAPDISSWTEYDLL